MDEISIDAIRRLSMRENVSLLDIDKLFKEFKEKVMELDQRVSNLTPQQKNLLRAYQNNCDMHGLIITPDVDIALAVCVDSRAVIYISEVDIYVIAKDEKQYEQFTYFDSTLYDMDNMPQASEQYYRIILGNLPQRPLLVFHKNNKHPGDTLEKLSKYFNCKVESFTYGDKIQYLVDKEYTTYNECLIKIQEFMGRNKRMEPPLYTEMPALEMHKTKDHKCYPYFRYPVPRYAIQDQWPKTVNGDIYIIVNNAPSVINFGKNKKYASIEEMRAWVTNNPPGDIKRADYITACKNALGAIKIEEFTNVVKERYRSKKTTGNINIWTPL